MEKFDNTHQTFYDYYQEKLLEPLLWVYAMALSKRISAAYIWLKPKLTETLPQDLIDRIPDDVIMMLGHLGQFTFVSPSKILWLPKGAFRFVAGPVRT